MKLLTLVFRKPGRRKATTAVSLFVSLALLLTACGGGAETTPDAEAQFTIAAQTAAALGANLATATQTQDPVDMVATVAAPSPTAGLPTTAVVPGAPGTAAGATPLPGTTPLVGTTPNPLTTPVATTGGAVQPPAQNPVTGPDAATYVADVTVPDDTVMTPGENFEKVWRISNTGTTTWTADYALVFFDGELMDAPAEVTIGQEVAPGEEIEIGVDMAAPEAAGTYTSYWKMRTDAGVVFGFGTTGLEAIWVRIIVENAAALNPSSGVDG